MGVTSDALLLTVYKEWYSTETMETLLWRASPVLRAIKKNRVQGKTYNFAANYGAGGACAGDATVAAANAASGASKNVQFAVAPGRLFSVFNVTQEEILSSSNIRGAFVPVPVVQMYASTAAFRRLYAVALYGMGYGEIGQVGSAGAGTINAGASNTIDLGSFDKTVKLDIDAKFIVTNGALPSSTLRTLVCTVTSISGNNVTFTAAAGSNETWGATDWIEIYGCRTGATPLLPVGLAAWLPTIANRTGGTWTSYIGTAFNGVDRSVFPDRLAGNYVVRDYANTEKYIDCVVRAVKAARNAGAEDDMWLVVNPDDYAKMQSEYNSQLTYFQTSDTPSKGKKAEFARGMGDTSFIFSTSFINKVWEDPYCPKLTAYILEEATIEWAMITNADTPVNDGITGNAAGVQPIEGVTTPDMKSNAYGFIFDDFVTVQPGSLAASGPVLQVILSLYGALSLRAPGHNCVINFYS